MPVPTSDSTVFVPYASSVIRIQSQMKLSMSIGSSSFFSSFFSCDKNIWYLDVLRFIRLPIYFDRIVKLSWLHDNCDGFLPIAVGFHISGLLLHFAVSPRAHSGNLPATLLNLQPLQCGFVFRFRKMFNFRAHKMGGNLGH